MDIEDLKINNRIQVDLEKRTPEPVLETYRGIVMDEGEDTITMVTDYGKEIIMNRGDVLSITKYVFDRDVSASMIKLKSFYTEKQTLLSRLEELAVKEVRMVERLLDANMLSKFNMLGAKNRLVKSMDQDMTEFSRGVYLYSVDFRIGDKNNLEIWFKVSNVLEHYQNEVSIDNLIRTHAPQETKLLNLLFKEVGAVEDIESSVVHVEGTIYEVISAYRLRVDLNKENYIEMRANIIKGLVGLRK